MIARHVKMTFLPDKKEEFIGIFEENKKAIGSFPGCTHLELIYNEKEPCVFRTYSIWNGTEDLNNYRNSALFLSVWKRVKPLFAAKTETQTIDLNSGKEIQAH